VSVLEDLKKIMETLPADSPTRGNLMCVTAAIKGGEDEERLLLATMIEFAKQASVRLRHMQTVGSRSSH
jgi:hypothetical protein